MNGALASKKKLIQIGLICRHRDHPAGPKLRDGAYEHNHWAAIFTVMRLLILARDTQSRGAGATGPTVRWEAESPAWLVVVSHWPSI